MRAIYEFNPDDAYRFAQEQGIKAKPYHDELIFKFCPYCRNSNGRDQKTFAINLKTGQFNCFRASCGAKGNMITLAKDFGFSLGRDVDAYLNRAPRFKNMRKYPRPKTKPAAVAYMESRGISQEITESYAITTQRDNDKVLVFPFFDEDGDMQYAKYRNTEYVKGKTSGSKEWCEANCKPILFGMDKCNVELSDTLVMTEGQIDSLSCAEAGIQNAVSVPTGCNGFTWIPYCWDFLGRFNTLIVFGDREKGHITLLEEMKSRFKGTVKHVRPEDYKDCKDANEILQKYGKQEIIDAVSRAIPVKDERIKDMADVEPFNLDKMPYFDSGIAVLDEYTSGFRLGQVVVITGERGNGKSTLASQFVTKALETGYNTLIYSGELMDSMVQEWIDRQIAGPEYIHGRRMPNGAINYSVIPEYANSIHDWYRGRCYVYDNSIVNKTPEQETLLDTIKKAISQYAVKVVLLDNLMTAMKEDLNVDLYRQQSLFVQQLADIAKNCGVLIFLVAHPRKGNGKFFDNDDISGSGNISNLAGMILQYTFPRDEDDQGDRILRLTKSRITGKTYYKGIPLWFDERSKRITDEEGYFTWDLGVPQVNDSFVDVDELDIPFGEDDE